MKRTVYLASTALLALALASPAAAQTTGVGTAGTTATPPSAATATPPAAPGDIVVTAQKRSERLQQVPVAVSVVSGDALASQGHASIEGAQYLVPSLNFLKSGTTLNQSVFLRGVGTATFSIAGEPSVSTVVDGVVYSRAGEAFSDLVDIDRMEVLRGPQGTLFGKNASAGVINIVSKQPTNSFGGYAEAGYGTDGDYRVRGAVNAPLSENIRSRLTAFYDNFRGNIRNTAHNNQWVNGWEHYGARLQIAADATPDLKLSFIADYHHNNDNCCAELIGTGTPVTSGTTVTGFTTTNAVFTALPTPMGDQTRAVAQDLITSTKETGYGFSLQGDLNLNFATLTSITAYRNWKNTEIRDGDFLDRAYIGFNQLHDFGPQTGDTFTQELRLTSPGHQFVDYVIGGFYSKAKSERVFSRYDVVCSAAAGATITALTPCTSPLAAPSTSPSGTADFGSNFENLAAFGQVTLNVTRAFRLIGGLRYSDDHLDVFETRVSTSPTSVQPGIQPNFDQGVYNQYVALVNAGTSPTAAATAAATASNGVPWRTSTHATNLSGKAGVQLDLSRQSTAYATYTRGYKGPAYNVFFNLTGTGTNVISPETSDAYEIGLKNTLLGGRLVLNLAAFYAKYHNFQANNPDLVAGVVVTRFTNAGEISTRGVELDFLARPSRDFTLSGGLAYTDAHVDQFNAAQGAPATAIIPSGTSLGFAPKWKGNVQADYHFDVGGLRALLGASASYQSSELALFAPDPIQRQLGTIKAYGLVNLSAGVSDQSERYSLTVQVRNLFDTSFAAAIANGGPAGSYRYQIPRDADRYVTITGRVKF